MEEEKGEGREELRAQRGHTGQPTQVSQGVAGVDTTLPLPLPVISKDYILRITPTWQFLIYAREGVG